ncbi:MAG: phosphoribosyltransferase family protein [Anaerolineae bacterium]
MRFANRAQAGRLLADRLLKYANRHDVVVLGLPRGGVPVAVEVAEALHAPLDVMGARKLGVPGFEELAMGAVASGGARVLNDDVLLETEVPWSEVEAATRREMRELERREVEYRAGRPPLDLRNRLVILVDDGLATGATMRAAIAAARTHGPLGIVVAVPTGAHETVRALRPLVDEVVTVITPEPFMAVGLWYLDFTPTTDDEVRDLLAQAASFFSEG